MQMIPAYKDMNSYPCKRNQMPSNQYYHPSWEAVTPQMKEDPLSSSCTLESWPYYYGYPVPMQCHYCCTHGQHPGYYNFRPPCSHFPPPPPPPPAYHYSYGGYPPYPQPYPMYYTPPPHYSMELPRYEYEKKEPRDQFHCCGCLNHPGNVKGKNNVKIEEQEPDAEVKKSESPCPARANNFSHPIMWIPPEYIMNKEHPKRLVENEENEQRDLPYVKKPQEQQRPTETDAQENKGIPHGRKPHLSVLSTDQDPKSGCFPLDINKIKQLMEVGDVKQTCEQDIKSKDEKKAPDIEIKDQNKHPSYPVFWTPYVGREEESLKGDVESTAGGTADEGSPAHGVLPEKIEDDNETEKQNAAGVDDGRNRTMGTDKKRIVKTIPVKQLEESAPKLSKKEEEHKQQVSAKNNTSMQSSSPTKKSKLPPICLRIDPPKKKNGTGSLWSPPGDKIRQDSNESKLERKTEQQHKEIKVKDAEKKAPSQTKIEVSRCAEEDNDFLKDKDKSADVQRGDCRVEAQEIQAAKESEVQPENKQKRKVMSEMEAATIIQAACRGHDVRRSEPIKRLKQIANVHEEAIQVGKQLEDLESRAPINDKEKATTGEAIMKLLLELDSMQGLHQSVRDFRKSVAKELIRLQEKLDSIMSQPSIVLTQDISTARAAEEPPKDYGLVDGSGVIVESAGQRIKGSSLDGDYNVNTDEGQIFSSSDPSSSQPVPCHDGVSGFENRETSEDSLVKIEAKSDGDIAPPSLGLKMKEGTDVSKSVQENSSMEFQKQPVDKRPDLESCNKNEEAPREVVDIAVDNGLLTRNNEPEQNLLGEVHQDVDDESLTNLGIIEDRAVENDMVSGKEDHKTDIMSELPKDVEEDGKDDVELTDYDLRYSDEKDDVKQPHEDASSVPKVEKEEHEVDLLHNLSPEVNNDDSNELTEVDTSPNLNKNLVVDHPSEKPEVVENQESKSEICEQQLPVGTFSEHEMQQSKEVDGALGQYLEGQSLAVAGEMEMNEQNDKKIIEENEKLRAMLEKLLAAEKQQQEVISSLNGKVKDLEKKLDRRKNKKLTKIPRVRVSRPCGKLANDSLRGRPTGIAS